MKILQVIPYFAWEYGGPVKVVYDLSHALAKKGHEVTIYTTNVGLNGPLTENQKIKSDVIQIKYFNCLNNFLANNLKLHLSSQMRKAIKNNINSFDVVHLHEWRGIPNLYVWNYAKKCNVPYVLQGHGSSPKVIGKQERKLTFIKSIFNKLFEKKIVEGASKVIAISKEEFDQYKNFGVEKDKIEIIGNSIDISEYQNLPEKGIFRHKYGIGINEKIILYLGRIDNTKGIDMLLKSFKELVKEMEELKLVIVGPDHGYLSTLENLVEKFKIKNKISIIGPLYGKGKLEAYVDANMLVYPSFYEIFGLVPLEALLCGTAVIVTNNCGCSELISDLKCGHTIKYGDVIDLKEKMAFILTHEKETEELTKKGNEYIRKNLHINKISKKFEDIYYKFVGNN